MKLKDGWNLYQVADTWVGLPLTGTVTDFRGCLTLNETGALLWKTLEKGEDKEALVNALTAEYDVDYQQAAIDVDEFIESLRAAGCLED